MLNFKRYVWLILLGLILSFCIICGTKEIIQANSLVETKSLYIPPRQDFRIVVISDLNSQYGSTEYEPEVKNAIALMSQWQPDLVLCGGDAIAGQKASLTKSQIKAMWSSFDLHIAAPLREQQIPFGFTIGNHDGSGAIKRDRFIFQGERDLARAYWLQHQDKLGWDFVDRGDFPFYYSFHKNGIFFLVWDASTQNISEAQLNWVERTSKSNIAQQASTRIAIGHLPLYPIVEAKNKPGEYLANGSELRSLLEKNNFQVYISGHHHAYYPGKQGNLELLHAGALGQGSRQLIGGDLSPYPAVTIIDLEIATSEFTYTTYNAKTWELITLKQLPRSIKTERGIILRRDL